MYNIVSNLECAQFIKGKTLTAGNLPFYLYPVVTVEDLVVCIQAVFCKGIYKSRMQRTWKLYEFWNLYAALFTVVGENIAEPFKLPLIFTAYIYGIAFRNLIVYVREQKIEIFIETTKVWICRIVSNVTPFLKSPAVNILCFPFLGEFEFMTARSATTISAIFA